MELRESDKHIGKYVIVGLTPEAEKYISDVSVGYHPFGKIENHASMVDFPNFTEIVKFMGYLDRLISLGLTFSKVAVIAYEEWKILAEVERIYTEYTEKARRLSIIAREGCAACDEFKKYFIGKDEYGFCRHCNKELGGMGSFEMNYRYSMAEYRMTYVPEPNCKYLGGGK